MGYREDAIAEYGFDRDGKPCVSLAIREMHGMGWDEKAFVSLDLAAANDLLDELTEAVRELERVTEPTEAQQGLIPIPDGYAEQ